MADNEPDKSEKTEPASPFKLEEARRKGSVAKSVEVNTFLAICIGILFLITTGMVFIENTLSLCRRLFASAGQISFETRSLVDVAGVWSGDGVAIMAPLVALVMLVAIVGTFIQIGPVFSFFPLKPDIKRLNPVTGFKRIFSQKLLYELAKSLVKVALFGTVLYVTLESYIDPILALYSTSLQTYLPKFLELSGILLSRLAMVLALFAAVDFIYTRWDYKKNLRMTKKEVKDEHKRREGDPMVRQKRRSLERELRARSQSLGNVAEADLVITNPTRYAVVLKYDRDTMIAPVITGKGADEMARLIRQEAYRHRVPVINAPSLTRALYRRCELYSSVPQKHYVALAQAFRLGFAQRGRREVSP